MNETFWRFGINRLLFLLLAWLTLLPVITPLPVMEHRRATEPSPFLISHSILKRVGRGYTPLFIQRQGSDGFSQRLNCWLS